MKVLKRLLIALLCLCVLLAAGAYWYDRVGQKADPNFNTAVAHPAYAASGPRIVFDQAHRNFHTASGRYRPFAELLRHDGYRVDSNTAPFSAETLRRADVLIVANALGEDGHETHSAFTPEEIDALATWVDSGGSLLLIADHSPFGWAARDLAKRLGVTMYGLFARDDAYNDGDNERLVFSRANHLLADNPITDGRSPAERVNRVVTFTGQSLVGPAGSTQLLRLSPGAYDWASRNLRYPAAGHAQGLAFALGRGRVVVFGEAALFSAQVDALGIRMGMNKPGNDDRQVALNVVHWLSGALR